MKRSIQTIGTPAMVLSAIVMLLVGACSSPVTGAAPDERAGTASASTSAPAVTGAAPMALIVDASGSMLNADAPGVRMDADKSAAVALVQQLPDDAPLALLTYGTGTGSEPADFDAGCRDVTVLQEVAALDRAASAAQIEALAPSGYTPIGAALTKAVGVLPEGPGAIVLVSDGEDMCSPPPCEVARSLAADHPQLTISTVGFRADGQAADQLSCTASAGRGVFVTADNAAQLTLRLRSATNLATAKESLTATGRFGIEIGDYHDEIVARADDFPALSSGERRTMVGERVVIVWRDCSWEFTPSGELVGIVPGPDVRTIDGLTVGMSVADAIEMLGSPVSDHGAGSDRMLTFPADEQAGSAWRVGVDGVGDGARVRTIVLCRCLPGSSAAEARNQVPAAHSGTLMSPGEIETSGVCGNACDVEGFADVEHPSWGKTRIFMTAVPRPDPKSGGKEHFALTAIDTDGRARWRYELSSLVNGGNVMKPAKDASGNVFFTTTEGQYITPVVLRPTTTGFEHFGTLSNHHRGRFVGYERILGADGLYEFRPLSYDEVPADSLPSYRWSGSTYVTK